MKIDLNLNKGMLMIGSGNVQITAIKIGCLTAKKAISDSFFLLTRLGYKINIGAFCVCSDVLGRNSLRVKKKIVKRWLVLP